MKIGVSAPGSGTHLFVNLLLMKDGLKPDEVTIIGVGTGAGAIAAIQKKQIDALVSLDPVTSKLENSGDVVTVVDTRTKQGQQHVYGLQYAAGVISAKESFIQKHPATVQAVVNAIVRALLWIQTNPPEKIMAALPLDYYGNNKELYLQALRKNLSAFSQNGTMSREAAQNVYTSLAASYPIDKAAANNIDLQKTFDNHFAIQALKKYKAEFKTSDQP